MKTQNEMKSELKSLVDEIVLTGQCPLDRDAAARIIWLLAHATSDVELLRCCEDYERRTGARADRGGIAGG